MIGVRPGVRLPGARVRVRGGRRLWGGNGGNAVLCVLARRGERGSPLWFGSTIRIGTPHYTDLGDLAARSDPYDV